MQVQGRIDYINTRDTKVGTTYDIKVNGANYGLFKTPCPFPEGSIVKFEATEKNGFKNVVKGTLQLVEDAAPKENTTSSGGDQASGGASSYDKRQKSIEYQSSRNLAGQVLASLVAADAIPMPAKSDKGARYEAMIAMLDDLTWKFFEEVDGLEEAQEQRAFEKAQRQEEE